MSRLSKADYYLNIALDVANRSTCLKKHYGAVVVNNDEIISTGFNGPPRGEPHCTVCTKISNAKNESSYCSCGAVHAEMNALLSAARRDMIGATLYLAGYYADYEDRTDAEISIKELPEKFDAEPCEICLRLIKNSGIKEVINRTGVIYRRGNNNILERC